MPTATDPDRDNQEPTTTDVCKACAGLGWHAAEPVCTRCYGTGHEPQQPPQPTQEEALF